MRETFSDLLGLGANRVDSDICEFKRNVGLTSIRDFVPCDCSTNVKIKEVVGVPVTLLPKLQITKRGYLA